jgi:hypothetical protein
MVTGDDREITVGRSTYWQNYFITAYSQQARVCDTHTVLPWSCAAPLRFCFIEMYSGSSMILSYNNVTFDY